MVYALIPARVGSKGVPNKNWKPLNGKSCVQRAVECAQAAGITEDPHQHRSRGHVAEAMATVELALRWPPPAHRHLRHD